MPGFDQKQFIAKWESQVRKGLLDFIILLYLNEKKYYGYELITQIKNISALDISEGTIYPLLNRLKKEGLIDANWVEQESGIPRKYYNILPGGQAALVEMKSSWLDLTFVLQKLLVTK